MNKFILITTAIFMASASTAHAAQWCKPQPGVKGTYNCKYESASFMCTSNLKPNGCSAPTDIAPNIVPTYNKKFKSACFDHDMCYYFGSTKATCDAKFLAKMKVICGYDNKACSSIAAAYYAGVVAAPFAKQAYDGGQNHRRRHCSGKNIGEKVAGAAKNTVNNGKKAVVKAGGKVVNGSKKLIGKIGGVFK